MDTDGSKREKSHNVPVLISFDVSSATNRNVNLMTENLTVTKFFEQ